MNARDVALAALAAGISTIPPTEDGSKRPLAELKTVDELTAIGGEAWARGVLKGLARTWTWAHFQKIRPTRDKIDTWYAHGRTGVGLVCGAISGHLECFEFDDEDAYATFRELADASGLASLVRRIVAGYCELTPGGGVHWLYRVDLPPGATLEGNTKLAQRPKRPEEQTDPHETLKVLIETRSEGGYVVIAPSNGRVHPTGGAYELVAGGVDQIVTITPEERRELFALARSLDQIGKTDAAHRGRQTAGDRPGDAFARATSWRELLEPAGWSLVTTRGEEEYWRRPGKRDGVSATVNYAGSDLLYVFTTSTAFEAGRAYTKFAAYAILNHAGDFKAAAAALAAKGFGASDRPPPPTEDPTPPPSEDAWHPRCLLSDAERCDAVRDTLLDHFLDYARQRTDAPPEFGEAFFLAALSVVVGRRAVLRLTTGPVYPSLWVLVIADSSIYRKSTVLNFVREVVELVSPDLLTPSDFTPQRFVAILAEHDGKPLFFARDELSGFYEGLNRLEFMSGLKEILLNVYDGYAFSREKMKRKGRKGDEEDWRFVAKEPFLSIAAATTMERFSDVALPGDVHSGFLPRFGIVLPRDPPRPPQPITELTDEIASPRDAIVARLRAIQQRPIHLTAAADYFARFNRYVADLEAEAIGAPNQNLVAIVNTRAGWMAARIAILLAVADGTDRVDRPHLVRAIEIVERWRHNAIALFAMLAPSQFERKASKVLQLVQRKGTAGILRRDVMRALRLSKKEMDDIQETLAERGEIRLEARKTRTWTAVTYIATTDQGQE